MKTRLTLNFISIGLIIAGFAYGLSFTIIIYFYTLKYQLFVKSTQFIIEKIALIQKSK